MATGSGCNPFVCALSALVRQWSQQQEADSRTHFFGGSLVVVVVAVRMLVRDYTITLGRSCRHSRASGSATWACVCRGPRSIAPNIPNLRTRRTSGLTVRSFVRLAFRRLTSGFRQAEPGQESVCFCLPHRSSKIALLPGIGGLHTHKQAQSVSTPKCQGKSTFDRIRIVSKGRQTTTTAKAFPIQKSTISAN
jgi:hypothetical protein